MSSYIIFWNKNRIETYSKNDDIGPLSITFGGPHQSQPVLGKIKIGDIIFPITVIDGVMYILGRMEIEEIITENEFLEKNIIENKENLVWDQYCIKYKNKITHKIPWNCMDNAAIGKN
jgi:beta-glucosidase/6-phospho-beta-glucosidase/beta-galactosidase